MKFSLKKLFGFVTSLAGLAFCGIGVWLLLSPAQYQAVVQVQIGLEDPGVYDPYFIQTEFEIVRSDLVLSNVIE